MLSVPQYTPDAANPDLVAPNMESSVVLTQSYGDGAQMQGYSDELNNENTDLYFFFALCSCGATLRLIYWYGTLDASGYLNHLEFSHDCHFSIL